MTTTFSLRAHAMLLLYSIYALRSSEVSDLQLVDIDWREETFCVKRAKRGGYQRYPLAAVLAGSERFQSGRISAPDCVDTNGHSPGCLTRVPFSLSARTVKRSGKMH